MSEQLVGIPVEVVSASGQDLESANMALPILNEIAAMLEALVNTGQESSLDLRRTPLAPRDYQDLREFLGQGELKAELDCLGLTRIRETAIAGVWWVAHYSAEGKLQGEFIEVTSCPVMLGTAKNEIMAALPVLRDRLDNYAVAPDRTIIEERLRAIGLDPSARSPLQAQSQSSNEAG